jgi:hypothetical protein
MKQQDDDASRREMSRALFLVLAGVNDLANIERQLNAGGLTIGREKVADGGDLFIIRELKNGAIYDHFQFSVGGFVGKLPVDFMSGWN